MNKAKTLVLSKEDWKTKYDIPNCVEMFVEDSIEVIKETNYDLVFIDRRLSDAEVDAVHDSSKAYTVFLTEKAGAKNLNYLIRSRKCKKLQTPEIQRFLSNEARNYFSESYGEKFKDSNILVNNNDFAGEVWRNGGTGITIKGDFGEEFKQILFWKNNIPIFEEQCIEFYLEYSKTEDVEIQLVITQYKVGLLAQVSERYIIDEDKLHDLVCIDNKYKEGRMFIALRAKGRGELTVKALHDRYSRRGHGNFIPGGQRCVSSKGEEVFFYFDPGDLKPPLNVYFSGYKTRQGFEGYHLMRVLKSPFILVSDSRLEGGAFYVGDDDYEDIVSDKIKECMKELGFTGKDVILSGLSMGTTGAFYYSPDIQPHAVIVGKPLASLGNVAFNERLSRPGGFPTSIDVLLKHTGGIGAKEQNVLNQKIWSKIDKGDYSNTIFAVAYMIEDDYDESAYQELLLKLHSIGVTVYGKGFHGRHNDDTSGIVSWFGQQFRSIMEEDFGR